jgi:hypothetical protein
MLLAMVGGFSSVQLTAALAYGAVAALWLREPRETSSSLAD